MNSVTYQNRDTGITYLIYISNDTSKISIENLQEQWKLVFEYHDSKGKLACRLNEKGVPPEDIQNIINLLPAEIVDANKLFFPKSKEPKQLEEDIDV